jgi:hypothetical protein
MRTLSFLTAIMALALGTSAGAQHMHGWSEELPVMILPGEIPGPMFMNGIPDQGFDPEWEWLALVCREKCGLEPTKLLMAGVQVQPHDGEAMPGHAYAMERELGAQPLVLLRGLPDGGRARPRTYLHATLGKYPQSTTRGTLEIDIPVPGEPARIVPRYLRRDHDSPLFNVYLETKTQRQLLGGMAVDGIGGPSAMARGPQLLRWAGDLDGDDKLDLIVTITSRHGEEATVTLFLSSLAKPGEMVGMAGHFRYWPVENPGC